MKIHHSLLLPRDAATVPAVRRLCRTAMEELGVVAGDIDDVTLALTEACANVVRHAASGGTEYRVEITIGVASCEMTVTDSGGGFEDAGRQTPLSQDLEMERGRGLPLMRALVDVAELRSQPASGTVVRLVKHLTVGDDGLLGRVDERAAGR
jgi:anti-sigma regulatory factor (Ser/Thr protein kinase)